MNEPVIAKFVAALVADRKKFIGKATEAWRHKAVLMDSQVCVYCGRPVEHRKSPSDDPDAAMLHIEHFISRKLGGPHEKLNLVASCASCNLTKGNKDWLACPLAPDDLARKAFVDRRMKVMETCQNHLLRTRETAKTKPYVLTLLRQRWAHPRFAIRAALTDDTGLIGFGDRDYVPDEIVVLLRQFGATPAAREGWIFFIPPDKFHALIWQLIDLNAWVRRLDLGEDFPDPNPPDDSTSRWHETFTNVGDIHRRREKLPWVHPSKRPPRIEKPMDPLNRLHLAGLVALKTGQPVDYEWLARHRESDEAFAAERKLKRDRAWATRHG